MFSRGRTAFISRDGVPMCQLDLVHSERRWHSGYILVGVRDRSQQLGGNVRHPRPFYRMLLVLPQEQAIVHPNFPFLREDNLVDSFDHPAGAVRGLVGIEGGVVSG